PAEGSAGGNPSGTATGGTEAPVTHHIKRAAQRPLICSMTTFASLIPNAKTSMAPEATVTSPNSVSEHDTAARQPLVKYCRSAREREALRVFAGPSAIVCGAGWL